MEQRRLRLGDILDDYCPRERRVTNHAVVAMVEEDVKQTRCTTCDAEHVYKGAKPTRRKKGESPGTLYKKVLAGLEDPVTQRAASDEAAGDDSAEPVTMSDPDPVIPADIIDDVEVEEDDSQLHMLPPDDGPVHRQLIRAQLPKVEGVKVERQAPEFTIRQNNGRNGGFRGRGFAGNGGGNGNGTGHGSGGGQRFGRGPNRGAGGGAGGGRAGQGGGGFGRNQGPRKRSR